MILDNHYAVVFRHKNLFTREIKILNDQQWRDLQLLAQDGEFIILECWNITKGKCVSN